MLKKKLRTLSIAVMAGIGTIAATMTSCNDDDKITQAVEGQVTNPENLNTIGGLYLLCQGNMGTNKCTIDRFDYNTGVYARNIFASINPSAGYGLGDMGNDIHILGNKLYVTVNGSNLLEVMDAKTSKHIKNIEIPNCRYIADDGKYIYVSSYSGNMGLDPTLQQGFVARIDTASLTITGRCGVGYQPEQMVTAEGRLYVANSGGYRYPDYDRTVSVIDLNSFSNTDTIDVAINLLAMQYDQKHGLIYVSSQGDYYTIPSTVSIIDVKKNNVTGTIPGIACKDMTLVGNNLYIFSSDWNYETNAFANSFAVYDTDLRKVTTQNLITDGTDKDITSPYGIAVNPENGDIFISDAGDFVNPGILRCYSSQGKLRWSTTTGDIPSRIAFLNR